MLGGIDLWSLSELGICLSTYQIACLRLNNIRSVDVLLASFRRLAVLKHDAVATRSDLVRADVDSTPDQVVLIRASLKVEFPSRLFDTLILVWVVGTVQASLSIHLSPRPFGREVTRSYLFIGVNWKHLWVVVVNDDLLGHLYVVVRVVLNVLDNRAIRLVGGTQAWSILSKFGCQLESVTVLSLYVRLILDWLGLLSLVSIVHNGIVLCVSCRVLWTEVLVSGWGLDY